MSRIPLTFRKGILGVQLVALNLVIFKWDQYIYIYIYIYIRNEPFKLRNEPFKLRNEPFNDIIDHARSQKFKKNLIFKKKTPILKTNAEDNRRPGFKTEDQNRDTE